MTESVRVTFLPANRMVLAQRGDTLLDVALENRIEMPHECGGNCACMTCHVHILKGADLLSKPEEVEQDRLLSAENLQAHSRLGCQAILQGTGEVLVELVEEATW